MSGDIEAEVPELVAPTFAKRTVPPARRKSGPSSVGRIVTGELIYDEDRACWLEVPLVTHVRICAECSSPITFSFSSLDGEEKAVCPVHGESQKFRVQRIEQGRAPRIAHDVDIEKTVPRRDILPGRYPANRYCRRDPATKALDV